jgi:hypothetical protein
MYSRAGYDGVCTVFGSYKNEFHSVPSFSFLVAFTILVLVQIKIFLQLNVPQFELYQSDFFIK